MNGAFYIGATGLRSQQGALDVTANNIANINTVGFKRASVRFSELIAPAPDALDSLTRSDGQPGLSGVAAAFGLRSFTQGDIKQTGSPMDLAIRGEGFIELLGPGGQARLWRGGALTINGDGFLAASNGMPLRAMISAPTGAREIAIAADGRVTASVDGAMTRTELGRIGLAMVQDPGALTALSDGIYEASDPGAVVSAAAGEDAGGTFVQGALEGSNVQIADEMVTLLLTQRAYAANAQVVQAGDQLMAIANGLKR